MRLRVSIMVAVGILVAPAVHARVQLDTVAAYVNDDVITVSDVVRASPALQRRLAVAGDSETLNAGYRQALHELIGQRLVLKAYQQQKRIQIPDVMVQQRIESIIREVFKGDRTALLEALVDEGLHYEQWAQDIREQVIIRTMQNVTVGGSVRVSPVAVRERYDSRRQDMVSEARADISMLVLPGEQEALAADLHARIREGADFAALAREHSIGARAADGGARGEMALDMLRDELADAVRGLQGEGVTAPVPAGDQLYIIRVHAYTPAETIPFAEAGPRIEEELHAEKEQRLYHQWIDSLRRNAYVQVLETAPF